MKKNININMFGQLFNIDEDAYQLLSRYLESVKSYFGRREGGEEIAEDIERHVAELMWQHSDNGSKPVSIDDINAIVSQIGNPSEMDNAGEAAEGEQASGDASFQERASNAWQQFNATAGEGMRKRYLFRDPNDKMIGGVFAGLARYVGWGSPTGLRMGAALLLACSLFFEAGSLFMGLVIGYIAMLVIVPLPRNAEDRLKMQGQPVTADALNQEMLRESNDAVSHDQQPVKRSGCLSALLKALLFILLLPVIGFVAFILFGLIFVVMGMFGALGALIPLGLGEMLSINAFLEQEAFMVGLAAVSFLLVVAIPVFALIGIARRNSNPEHKTHTGLYLVLWIIAISLLITSGVSLSTKAHEFDFNQSQVEWNSTEEADTLGFDTLEALPLDSAWATFSSDTTDVL